MKKTLAAILVFVLASNAFAMRQTPYQYRHIMAPQPTRKIAVLGIILANLPSVYAAEDENGPLGYTLFLISMLVIGVAIGYKLYSFCHRAPRIVPENDIEQNSVSRSNSTTIVNLHSEAGSPPNTPVSEFSDKDFREREFHEVES